MHKFLLRIMSVILPVVILFSISEYRLSQVPNSYNIKKSEIESNLDDIVIMNVGSSHAHYGIDTRFIKYKACNMADTSQSLYYDYQIINRYYSKMKSLKMVIIPISYFSLGSNLMTGIEYWRGFLYEKVYHFPLESNTYALDFKRTSYWQLYGHVNSIEYLFGRIPSAASITSIKDKDNSKTISDALGTKRAEYHTRLYNEKYTVQTAAMLDNIIEKLKALNIIPVLVTIPTYKTYNDHIDYAIYDRMQSIISSISLKYDVQYFNYMFDTRFSFDDFRDNDHLNIKGSEKFTKIINEEIIEKDLG